MDVEDALALVLAGGGSDVFLLEFSSLIEQGRRNRVVSRSFGEQGREW